MVMLVVSFVGDVSLFHCIVYIFVCNMMRTKKEISDRSWMLVARFNGRLFYWDCGGVGCW